MRGCDYDYRVEEAEGLQGRVMTQEEAILNYMRGGNTITSLEALDIFGCFRLASRISDLRQHYPNLNIQVDMVHNNGKKFAQYKLITKESQMVFA